MDGSSDSVVPESREGAAAYARGNPTIIVRRMSPETMDGLIASSTDGDTVDCFCGVSRADTVKGSMDVEMAGERGVVVRWMV